MYTISDFTGKSINILMILSGYGFNTAKIETVVPVWGVSYIEGGYEPGNHHTKNTPNLKYFLISFPREFLITKMHKISEIIYAIEYGYGELGWKIEVSYNTDLMDDLTLSAQILKVNLV